MTNATAALGILPPNGGLFGGATLINVLTGDAFTEDATALIQFTDCRGLLRHGRRHAEFLECSSDHRRGRKQARHHRDGRLYRRRSSTRRRRSTLALQKQTVVNEFVGEAATLSGTDWVVTFPTKHHFVDGQPGSCRRSRVRSTKTGSCDNVIAGYVGSRGNPGYAGRTGLLAVADARWFRAVLGSEHHLVQGDQGFRHRQRAGFGQFLHGRHGLQERLGTFDVQSATALTCACIATDVNVGATNLVGPDGCRG